MREGGREVERQSATEGWWEGGSKRGRDGGTEEGRKGSESREWRKGLGRAGGEGVP